MRATDVSAQVPFVDSLWSRLSFFKRQLIFWSNCHLNQVFYPAISRYVDWEKYELVRVPYGDGTVSEFRFFAKGFTPKDQVNNYLDSLDPEEFKHGVPIAQVIDNFAFSSAYRGVDNWWGPARNLHNLVWFYMNKQKYMAHEPDSQPDERKLRVRIYLLSSLSLCDHCSSTISR